MRKKFVVRTKSQFRAYVVLSDEETSDAAGDIRMTYKKKKKKFNHKTVFHLFVS